MDDSLFTLSLFVVGVLVAVLLDKNRWFLSEKFSRFLVRLKLSQDISKFIIK